MDSRKVGRLSPYVLIFVCRNRKQVRIDLRDILGQPMVGGVDSWCNTVRCGG